MTRAEIVDWALRLYEDLDLASVRSWLAAHSGRHACGYLPVYAPREVIRAAGMLPVGIHGGGDQIEIIRGDAYYQSYICHLPRSVIELAESGRLSALSAVLFPSTCDVIRNLSGMWKLMYPGVYVRYVDVPQLRDVAAAGAFWTTELRTLQRELCRVGGRDPNDDDLCAAISEYNVARRLVRTLYAARREDPERIPTEELYLLMRAGEVVPVDLFIARAQAYLAATEREPRRARDRIRVVVMGAFCEQPPLALIKTIERAGCAIVDDDFLLGNRFLTADVATAGDPAANLAETFIRHAVATSVLYEPNPAGKRQLVAQRVREARADGIIFASPSFCDPSLLDRQLLRAAADVEGIPSIAFKYAENTGQLQPFREQAGTFADSIKLWGGV
ncbi:MAG: benzoyl-CoA reductase subunit C [Candidatus Schekmanbacteria bacterium]|nr:benzoyl-CoA reductase subunit C [Candidatus Schekmanbacteria bacterium]